MDLRSASPFWPLEAGLIRTYPTLKRDETCQVAIIGGGITGALVADRLARAGTDCVLVEERDIGGGSTSASTGLLQYEIDTHLVDLAEIHGLEKAARAYRLCWEAIDALEALAHGLGIAEAFQRVPSLYLASSEEDVPLLEEEAVLRRARGMEVEFWGASEIAARFPFSFPAALWSEQAAQANPYRLAHALLGRAARQGARIYDRTRIGKADPHARGVTLAAETGSIVEAEHVVFATGYAVPRCLPPKLVSLNSTYALVSEPDSVPGSWHRRSLIWETARPYLYLRTTPDGRVLMGGADEPFKNAKARDALIGSKAEALAARFGELFPGDPPEVAYVWAGTFGETRDGLGYIGAAPEFSRGYFALGYGGNGITYGVIAAALLADLLAGRPNPDAELFSFSRFQA